MTTTTSGTSNGSSGKPLISQTLESGRYIESEISFPGEIHWYSFEAKAGDAVYLVLFDRTSGGEMVPWMGLISPDGEVLVEDYDWPNYYAVQIYYWIKEDGQYTVRVRDKNLGTGPYALGFSQLSKTVQPLSPGAIQSSLSFPGEAHWYTFDGKAGDSVYIVLIDSESGPLRPWLCLLDPENNVVFDGDDWPSYQASQVDYVLQETGEYLIIVRDSGLVGGAYTLTFNMLVMD
jgi:hypothetical protein